MTERRTEIFANNLMEKSVENYLELEGRMKELLGYTDRVSWMTIKEILTCYESHGIPFPEGITTDDAERVTRLSGWYLGALYQDDKLNQLGIGRFLRELLDVLHPAVHNLSTSSSPTFMIYSGHDATLVPVLCALGLYDGIWPPYASFLTLEILHLSTDPSVKYVRAVYNDDEKVIVGSDSVYCPYDIFFERLNSLSISDGEYSEIRSRGLVVKENCDDEKNAALLLSQQAVDDDMKATMANGK
jgi:lysophosphatidic acid phosphatase type 6